MFACLMVVNRRVLVLLPKLYKFEVCANVHIASRVKQKVALVEPMGSFTSAHKILNEDTADNDLDLSHVSTWDDLRSRCEAELAYHPPKIVRNFIRGSTRNESKDNDSTIRIMQWNVLSQSLALHSDKFVACPIDALSWWTRRWRLLQEVVSARPDVLCFQEVDHYQFFKRTLGCLGFRGTFFPKPDSPCYYIAGNNGPDGCAIFIDDSKYDLLDTKTRALEVWGYQSNQVAVLCHLRRKSDDVEFYVATTHLKARQGPLLATMRREQGKDLTDFIKLFSGSHPVIVTGDFNASPQESVYQQMTANEFFPLDSAYKSLSNRNSEPTYTTWKIRDEGECCQTLDYIFYSRGLFQVTNLWQFPTEEEIGEGRVPSYRYPSDHFSLVADLILEES